MRLDVRQNNTFSTLIKRRGAEQHSCPLVSISIKKSGSIVWLPDYSIFFFLRNFNLFGSCLEESNSYTFFL